MAEPIVHVIDDDEGMRASLDFLLQTAGLACRVYATAAEFLALDPVQRGCIITDVRMPEINGLQLIDALAARGSTLPVIVITGHGDIPMAVAAMKGGARDFIEKPFDDQTLLGAVASAMAAGAQPRVMDPEQARLRAQFDQLSPREADVLKGLIAGGSNKTIALDLRISPRTVEIYRANLMLKTGAASLAELVRLSILAGIA